MTVQWTLVTGGAKHLGAEIARTLAKNGHAICVHYNTSYEAASLIVAECKACGVEAGLIQGDFSSLEGLEDFFTRYTAQFPITKNLINNVGSYVVTSALSTESSAAYDLFQTNVHAPLFLMTHLAKSIKQEKGSIINIGTSGLQTARADLRAPVYAAAKMALASLTKSVAKELAPFDVRVNMVSPGQLEESIGLPADFSAFPMKRPGKYTEVARVVAFLLETANSYITGQNIEVAGGFGL